MNPVGEVTSAAKSAFTIRNIVVGLVTLLLLAAVADALGWTDWLLRPVTKAKAWAAARKAAAVLLVFATCAAATATNALWL